MKKMKTMIAGFLAVAMIFAAIPQNAEAAGAAPDGVSVYYDDTLDIEKFWDSNEATAPVLSGYVFGGWFTYQGGAVNEAGTTYTALKKAQLAEMNDTELAALENVCAKFVPAYVLSIKAQIDKDTKAAGQAAGTNDKAFLRVLSSVDTNQYEEIGFNLWYDKTIKETESTKVTKVFSKLQNAETEDAGDEDGWTPQEVFGSASKYFSVLRVDSISNEKCSSILYVRPYWVTKDGTTVEGLSKYVRVKDGYVGHEYISVPVNLMTGSPVAAGMLEMTYDSRLEMVEYDAGLLLPEMTSHNDTSDTTDATDTITFVGNVKEEGNKEPQTDIYANVWFKVKFGKTIQAGETLNFTVDNYSFCNWSEKAVDDIKAWDIQYLK